MYIYIYIWYVFIVYPQKVEPLGTSKNWMVGGPQKIAWDWPLPSDPSVSVAKEFTPDCTESIRKQSTVDEEVYALNISELLQKHIKTSLKMGL